MTQQPRTPTTPADMRDPKQRHAYECGYQRGQADLLAQIEKAIEASQADCRWTPDPDGPEICDEHAEIVFGPDGCEDSPRWWKAKALAPIRSAAPVEPTE